MHFVINQGPHWCSQKVIFGITAIVLIPIVFMLRKSFYLGYQRRTRSIFLYSILLADCLGKSIRYPSYSGSRYGAFWLCSIRDRRRKRPYSSSNRHKNGLLLHSLLYHVWRGHSTCSKQVLGLEENVSSFSNHANSSG